MKAVRTERELQCPHLDAELRARGLDLVLLPDGIDEAELARETADADRLLIAFFTREAMRRLEAETLARCDELLAGRPVRVTSRDPRLASQRHGVRFD